MKNRTDLLGLIKFIESRCEQVGTAHSIYSLITQIGYWVAEHYSSKKPASMNSERSQREEAAVFTLSGAKWNEQKEASGE